MTIRRLAPAILGILVLTLACTDLLGPRGGDSVRLVVRPSFGQVPPTALADNPASRVDNVHVLLRNAGGTVVLDTIVEWPLDQDTLRMEMDVVVQEQETFELTVQGRSGDRVLFQAGPLALELSEDDSGGTAETSPVLEYAGPGAEVADVEITGAPAAFTAGSAVTLGAVGTNDDGSDPGDLIMVWTSLDPEAATVNDEGRVQVGHDASRAVSIEGRVAFTTVSDTIGGPILPAELTVTPDASTLNALGAELTLTASLLGEDGGAVTGVAIEWSVADPSVLELTSEGAEVSAVATALTQGATRVVATAGELSDSADVTVDQTVARLDVEPDSVTLEQIGATAEATAAAFDANDNEVEDAEVAWSSGAEDVATVAEDGTITAVSPGTAWITAASDEASDSLLATVANAAPELAITVPADGATFGEGDTITFEGTAEDLEDGDLSASIQWSSDLDGELGTGASLAVDDLSIGSHTITATVSDSRELADSATMGIEVALPNLVLADLTIEASEPLTSTDTVRLTAEIVNAGQVESAAADVAVRVLDGANEAVLAEVIVEGPALAAGETFSLVLDLSEAALEDASELEVEGDSIIFEVEVDPDDALAETDETDNAQRSRPFEVEVEVDLPPGVTSGWVGTSSDWQDPSNWYPVGVPTAEDVVVIPASADAQPVLTASTSVGGLFLENGATLDVNGHTLTVTGDLDAGGTIVDGTGGGSHEAVVMTGEGAALQGTVPDLLITGQVGTVGTVQVGNDLKVAGEGAVLYVGPHAVRVGDDLRVSDGGGMEMHYGDGTLDVADNAEFSSEGGATSVGAAGLLVVGSDFRAVVVSGDGPAFVGTGTHRTIMVGTGPGATHDGAIEIELGEAGAFQHLELMGAFDVAFVGGVATVVGDLAVAMDGTMAADDLFVFGGLTAATESTMSVVRLHLWGAMDIAGEGFLVNEMFFAGDGQVIQPGLPYQNVGVFGRAALAGTTTVAEALHVAGEGAELTVGAHQLTVGADFTTSSAGMFRMEHAAGILDVNGFAGFAGGEPVLTAGTIRVAGDFAQGGGDGIGKRAFRAGPDHVTVFDGSGAQTIDMLDPGPPDGDFSFFGTLEVANTFVTNSSVAVGGDLVITAPVTFSAVESSVAVEGDVLTALSSDLSISSLFVGGDLGIDGGFDVFTTTFTGTDQSIPALPYEHVNVHGTAFLATDMQISGNLFVGQEFGSGPAALDISNETLEVGGNFHTQPANGSADPAGNSGVLVMQHSGSILDIQGNAFFEGGASALKMGTIRIGGIFSQDSELSGVKNNFAAGPHLRVVLDGMAKQPVDFMNPVESHFATLELANVSTAGVSLGTPVLVRDTLHVSPSDSSNVVTIVSDGTNELTVGGVAVNGLVLENAPLVIGDTLSADAPDITRFDHVTFQNFPVVGEVAQLTVRHPGAADPFVFDGLTFDQSPDPPLFIRVEDTDTADEIGLIIDLINSTPADGSSFAEELAGALARWP